MAGEGGYSLCLFGICIYFELEIGGCDAPLFTRAIFTFFFWPVFLFIYLAACWFTYSFYPFIHLFTHAFALLFISWDDKRII